MSKGKEFLRRYKNAASTADSWKGLHEECYAYALPSKNKYNNEGDYGTDKSVHLYDSTAVEGLQTFASRMGNLNIPLKKRWFGLKVSELIKSGLYQTSDEQSKMTPQEINKHQVMLDNMTKVFFHYWDNSNAYQQMTEGFLDFGVGTTAILINETNDRVRPFVFSAVNMKELAIEEGINGVVDTVFRKHMVPYGKLKDKWPIKNVTPDMAEKIANRPEEKVEVIEGVIKNENTKKFDYKVVLNNSSSSVIFEDVYNTNPWSVVRYSKAAGDTYGRGPVMQMLADIKLVNKAAEFIMRGAEKSVSELFIMQEDGIMNNGVGLNLYPDAIVPVQDVNGFARLPFQGRVDVAQIELQQKQFSIRKRLMADSIDRPKALSPEEIGALNQERLYDHASLFERISNELLEPIIRRVFDILNRKNIIDFEFDEEINVIEYTSPLAMIQKIQDNNMMLSGISQVNNALGVQISDLVVDKVEMAYDILRNNNIAEKNLKDKQTVLNEIENQKRQAEATAMAEQQQG